MSFPSSPSNGQITTVNGITYVYNSAANSWRRVASTDASIAGNLLLSTTSYVTGNVVPSANVTYNLGSPTQQWNALYVSSSTIYMDNKALSLTSEGLKIDGGPVTSVIDGGHADTWLLPV